MKILQINASYKPAYVYGGPTMSVAMLSEQLVKNSCSVEVFTTTANGKTELPVVKNIAQTVNGVRVWYFQRHSKDHSHFAPVLLLNLWKKARSFDVIHIHTWWNLVSILSCMIALLRGVPVVLSPRGTLSHYSFNHKGRLIKKLFHVIAGRYLLNRCHLHCTSKREQVVVSQLTKPLSVFNIYNLVKFGNHKPVPIQRNTQLKLLYLSRIEPKKGLKLLFNALAGSRIPWKLSIAGNGNQAYIKQLKALSHQYGIEDRITWLGFKGQDKFKLMARHEVLVLPSYDENFGNVIIESLSMGTAVLVSNKVGLARYVQKNSLGWVCNTNSHSLKDNLNNIYQHPAILQSIRRFAPQIIAGDFNKDLLIKQYLQMYQQIIPTPKNISNIPLTNRE